MDNNYTIIHLHTMLSNGTTNIDSITKFEDYVDKAKELNMKAIAFTEHGNLFSWKKKKECCEKNGLKYIHGVECYITSDLCKKIRDNYHTCLYASNFEGFKELNKLISKANNRNDNHYYYVPRITIDEFLNLSDNIIISSACLGGVLNKCKDNEIKQKYLNYFIKNKHRCFLEIQHHQVDDQINYNKYLYELHEKYDIPLIVGTDTHALNKQHLKGRTLLQKSKGIFFENENGWDLSLKTYDELIELYKKQNTIPIEGIHAALENTNKLADMVEEYSIDKSYKYPKLYDNSQKIFKEKIYQGVINRGINKKENYQEYKDRINYEYKTMKTNGSIDFFLLEEDLKSMCRKNNIKYGYSRGSVSGSEIAYALYITEIDSIKHKMNFERFMNLERVSLADVDTDYAPKDREKIKDYLFNKRGLYCSEIITFNTIALKGAIRDVCRALYKKDIPTELKERAKIDVEGYGTLSDSTSEAIKEFDKKNYLGISDYICSNIENDEEKMRKEYPKVFEYVDILQGVIVSVGTHPCGFIVSPIPLDENIGLFTTSTSKYPISQINMKEVDSLNFVKLDILGLDNIQVINEVCELANIERLTPDNINENDEKVWNSILEDNLGIFQWESYFAHEYYKKLFSKNTISKIKAKNPNFSYMDLFSIGNGAIRPAGSSYREALSNGEYKDNGHKALNDFLAPTLGYLVYQEQIIEFLHSFCGFTMGEADIVRRGFAKKTGTGEYIPRIKDGFTKTMLEKYNTPKEESEKIIVSFIQVIEDASSYLFSENHAKPYSYIGYACAWLRYYYPLEFLTVCSNIWSDDNEKTNKITTYAHKKSIKIVPPKFRYSKSGYFFDREVNCIYKGIGSIKYLNSQIADELYQLRNNKYNTFVDVLKDIKEKTSCDSRQLEILIKLNFFSEFGKNKKLLQTTQYFNFLYGRKQISKDKANEFGIGDIIEKHVSKITEKIYKDINIDSLLLDIYNNIPNESISIPEQLESENDVLGYITYTNQEYSNRVFYVSGLEVLKSITNVKLYCIKTGRTTALKMWTSRFNKNEFTEKDFIYLEKFESKPQKAFTGETDLMTGKKIYKDVEGTVEYWLQNYKNITYEFQ